jgi:predicted O-linked N-acetylglucosamine transferase (SPINDLY family)
LPEDRFVLCCFSNHYKMTEPVFGAWMSVLQRSPDSVLWMVGDNEWARDSIVRSAEQRGIARDRIVFASRVGPDEYMARLSLADLFLDTFPYNAGTIASDAIRMGLPLATISGQAFASRMAGRLLTAMGAHDGIASNVQQYIEFATRMATDPDAYAAYKALFNAQSWQRAIGDITSFTAAYEATLLSIAKRG